MSDTDWIAEANRIEGVAVYPPESRWYKSDHWLVRIGNEVHEGVMVYGEGPTYQDAARVAVLRAREFARKVMDGVDE